MIHLTNISKQCGQSVLFKDASFQIRPGDKIGLVGPNGAGKTTLFRTIVGEEGVDSGEINIADRLVIGYFSQSVGENFSCRKRSSVARVSSKRVSSPAFPDRSERILSSKEESSSSIRSTFRSLDFSR